MKMQFMAFNQYQKHLYEGIEINLYDQCQLQLYNLLQESNTPKRLYDKVIKWANSHCNIIKDGKLKYRPKMMSNWIRKVSSDHYTLLPICSNVTLSSGRNINITTFSLRNKLFEMIGNRERFKGDNLILNMGVNIKEIPDISRIPYGEPNTGIWYQEAVKHCCPTSEHFLPKIGVFIDELKIDKFGKLGAEAILCCLISYKRDIRNTRKAWFFQDKQKIKNTSKIQLDI